MPKLHSMRLDAKEAKKEVGVPEQPEGPKFPFGLTLELDEVALSKMGIDGMPKVKDKLIVGAKAEVVSVSSHERTGGKPRRNVRIQITDLALAKDSGSRKKTEDVLYTGA